jgi:hypothetical protein
MFFLLELSILNHGESDELQVSWRSAEEEEKESRGEGFTWS